MTPLSARIGRTIATLPPDIEVGICVRRNGIEEFVKDSALVLPTASIGKVFLLIETARAIRAGQVSPDELLPRAEVDPVGDSGLWQHLAVDSLPLSDVAWLVGGLSDNLATNVLLARLGLSAVQRCQRDLGMHKSGLLDQVRDERQVEHPGALSVGAAGELAGLMEALDRSALPWPGVAELVLDWLSSDADLSMVASAFGLDPLSHHRRDRGVLLHHKTGTDNGVRAEIGVVSGESSAIAYAMLVHWDVAGLDYRDSILAVMGGVGSAIAAALEGRDA